MLNLHSDFIRVWTCSRCPLVFGCRSLQNCRGTGVNSLFAINFLPVVTDLSAQRPAADSFEGAVLWLGCFYWVQDFRMQALECPCDCCRSHCTRSPLQDPFCSGEGPGHCLRVQELWLWVFHGCSMVQNYSLSQFHSLGYYSKGTQVAHLDSSFHCLWL